MVLGWLNKPHRIYNNESEEPTYQHVNSPLLQLRISFASLIVYICPASLVNCVNLAFNSTAVHQLAAYSHRRCYQSRQGQKHTTIAHLGLLLACIL